VEEAFGIPTGTLDSFFNKNAARNFTTANDFLAPQHRLRLNFYPAMPPEQEGQGVGPHKDMAGWLTFLHQVGTECALDVQDRDGSWIPVDPIPGTLVVNLGHAFEAATEGAARATVHRVRAPSQQDRYSIPFFMGLPLDLTLSEIQSVIPESVRAMRRKELGNGEWAIDKKIETFLDPRWDNIGESVLRRFIRGYKETALKYYGQEVYEYYTQ
jgi:isopenicillin N synthase-like dioxygenase